MGKAALAGTPGGWYGIGPVLELNYNLQTKLLVSGLQNPKEFTLPPFFLGERIPVRVRALQPTGNPAAPFEVKPIAALVLALDTFAGDANAIKKTEWIAASGVLSGPWQMPDASPLIGATEKFVEAVLVARIYVDGNEVHIERPAILRRPAFTPEAVPLAPGETLETESGEPLEL